MIWSGCALMESILVTSDSASIAGNPMRAWCKSFSLAGLFLLDVLVGCLGTDR